MAVGAATILGSFSAKLGMDTQDYTRGVLNAEGVSRVFGQTFATFISNPLLGSVALLKKVGGAFLGYSQEILGTAEAVQRLGQVTGASVELIQALQQRLDLAGPGADKASLALTKLVDAAARGNPTFERIGVNLENIGSTDQLLEATVEALFNMTSEGERTSAAMALMGQRAGPALVDAIGGGSAALRQMKEEATDLGLVLETDTINTLANFNTTVGFTGQAVEGLKQNFVGNFLAGFAGQFDTGTDSVQGFVAELNNNLAPLASEIGRDVGRLVGNMDELVDSLQEVAAELKDILDWYRDLKDGIGGAKEIAVDGQFGGFNIPILYQISEARKDALDTTNDAVVAIKTRDLDTFLQRLGSRLETFLD
jgi:predicted hydrocarbon binding protein